MFVAPVVTEGCEEACGLGRQLGPGRRPKVMLPWVPCRFECPALSPGTVVTSRPGLSSGSYHS